MNDPIVGRTLPSMIEHFPNAPVTETEAGHFLQEEVPGVIAAAVMRVVDEV
jgi:haloalkane dehalogenase